MEPFRPLSTSDQLAQHLRHEIFKGTLSGTMPGIKQLVQSLGVNSVAVTKAVQQLEREGLVAPQGDRRSRLISKTARSRQASLKVGMLYYDDTIGGRPDTLNIKQELANAGHTVVVAPKSMVEMGMDATRTARLVRSMDVDAWVVYAGSRPILEWFEQHDLPAFALHGRLDKASLAGIGVSKMPVMSALVSKLVAWGHSRIVMLAREERRKPHLGTLEQSLIYQLEAHGIHTGSYNIPDWEDTPEGLEKIIRSLFQYTPPTALIVGDSNLLHAVQVHLAQKGILAPKHISLFCNDMEQSFTWTRPEISHIRWDHRPTVRRVVQWANHVAHGKEDRKKSYINAALYEGGTIGPVAASAATHLPQRS